MMRPLEIPRRLLLVAACCLGVLLVLPVAGQSESTPTEVLAERDWIGWWIVEQPDGDTLYIIVKSQGRASSFFSGEGGSDIDKGTWEYHGNRIRLTWPDQYRDVIDRRGSTFVHFSFPPSAAIDTAQGGTIVHRLGETGIGSLTVDDVRGSDLTAAASQTTLVGVATPKRSEYIGFWEATQGRGQVFLFLRRGGKAFRAEAGRKSTDVDHGTWTDHRKEARIEWADGTQEVVRKEADGFVFTRFDRGGSSGGSPSSRSAILKVEASRVGGYFDLARGTDFSSDDFVGYWTVEDMSGEMYYVHVERYSQVSRYFFTRGVGINREYGRWSMLGDGLRITWEDGTQDTLRWTGDGMRLASFQPDVPVTGVPLREIPANKVEPAEFDRFFAAARTEIAEIERAAIARQQAAEEARKLAREAARKRALADARMQAEEEARRRAGDDARRRATEIVERAEAERTDRTEPSEAQARREEERLQRATQIAARNEAKRIEREQALALAEARRLTRAETDRRKREEYERREAERRRREENPEYYALFASDAELEARARQRAGVLSRRQLEAEARRLADFLSASDLREKARLDAGVRSDQQRRAQARDLAGVRSRSEIEAEARSTTGQRAKVAMAAALAEHESAETTTRLAYEAEGLTSSGFNRLRPQPPAAAPDTPTSVSFWEVKDDEGDPFTIQLLPNGLARNTWSKGTGEFKGQAGKWTRAGNAYAIDWSDGRAFRIVPTGGTFQYLSVAPDDTARGALDVDSTARPLHPDEAAVWQLAFEATFEAGSLESGGFTRDFPTPTLLADELSGYDAENVVLKDGRLVISSTDYGTTYGGRELIYVGGAATTAGAFNTTYAYVEVRCRVPEGQGHWASVGLMSAANQRLASVLEVFGHEPDRIWFGTADAKTAPGSGPREGSFKGPDMSRGFHTVGLKWTARSLTSYVDGTQVGRITEGIPSEPLYLAAGLAVGGSRAGPPSGWTPFPARFAIEHIRVYQSDAQLVGVYAAEIERRSVEARRDYQKYEASLAAYEEDRKALFERQLASLRAQEDTRYNAEIARMKADQARLFQAEFDQLKEEEDKRYDSALARIQRADNRLIQIELDRLSREQELRYGDEYARLEGVQNERYRSELVRVRAQEETRVWAAVARLEAEREERQKAEAEARRKAEEETRGRVEIARREAEEAARRQAEVARQEAAGAVRRAAELAQLQVEEAARRNAEQVALRRQEMARRQAERELELQRARAIKQTQEEARRLAEIAQRKAAQDARLAAEMRRLREAELPPKRTVEPFYTPETPATAWVARAPRPGAPLIDDEFSEAGLSSSTWTVGTEFEHLVNRELSGHQDRNLKVADGRLQLTAKDWENTYAGQTLNYSGSKITTKGKVEIDSGYVQVRCKVPLGKGIVSSVTLIDHATDKPVIAVHLAGSNPDNAVFEVYPDTGPILSGSWEGEDFSLTFHSVAIEWRADTVSFYVDGIEVQRLSRKIPQTRAYIQLSIAVGGVIAGPVSGWTTFPAYFEIDSVRIHR